MRAAAAVRKSPEPSFQELEESEQRFVIHGVSWKEYVILREALDVPGLRMAYCRGALELMSPSPGHEVAKKMIGRLVEMFAFVRDVPLYGYGSTTFRREAEQKGIEPDECWCVGDELRESPDIALEVVFTSGGIDKLDIYHGLGVREVWFWVNDGFELYQLVDNSYVQVQTSSLIPELDFELLAKFARRRDQPQAVKEYRDALVAKFGAGQF